jgi:hypothetical protein
MTDLKVDQLICQAKLLLNLCKIEEPFLMMIMELTIVMMILILMIHIELDDELIKNDPSFFKNISKFNFQNYNIDLVIKESLNYFKSYTIKDSHPSSRKLIILKK